MRADLFLWENRHVNSRTQAQQLIKQGKVSFLIRGQRVLVTKPSQTLPDDPDLTIEIAWTEADRFVSRGGVKLAGALTRTGILVAGMRALDIGISTGGFTDCLLKNGATQVVGVDVGHAQLAPSLRADSRLQCLEGVNARELPIAAILRLTAGHKLDLIVVDVSFISLALVLPPAIPCLAPEGQLLALVKPQFEVGREHLGKNGIVKDPAQWQVVKDKISKLCLDLGLRLEDYFPSSIEGGDGNHEFFIYAKAAGTKI